MVGLSDIIAIESLPALPAAMAKAIPLMVDPDSDQRALLDIIRHDEAMASAVLKLGNSSRFGVPGKHFDVGGAMNRIGRTNLCSLLLSQQVARMMEGENDAFQLRRGDMWRSALGGAIAAEELTARHAPDHRGLAFACGLLRDMGKLALDLTFGDRYLHMVNTKGDDSITFAERERACLGFDHAMVGAELARAWGLPERMASVIETHHNPPPFGKGHDVVADLVHAGGMVCLWAGFGLGIDGVAYRLADHVRESLGYDRPTAERDIATVWQKANEAQDALAFEQDRGVAA